MGALSLVSDGEPSVAEELGMSRFVQHIGSAGVHRIRVAVDDPGAASRVDVVIDSGSEERALTSVDGYPLPLCVVADMSISVNLMNLD